MISKVIEKIETELADTFNNVYKWLDADAKLLDYTPKGNGWTIRKNLEHIALTNHYLLILINKATVKAVEKLHKTSLAYSLAGYDIDWEKMEPIGRHKSFEWTRPDHMEPTGLTQANDIKAKLQLQEINCIDCLDKLRKGEGAFYTTMMSVNGLGKIDVYHYIYFLVQHAKRHNEQMQKTKLEFEV